MRRRISKLGSVGDTIVEVLLAIAIVSVVLGGAYASATRSTQGLRQSQERGEALKILEAQLEQLKNMRSAGLKPPADADFCVAPDPASGQVEFVVVPSSPSDAVCKTGPDNRYALSLRQDVSNDLEYQANVLWDRVSGGVDQERISITYRVEK